MNRLILLLVLVVVAFTAVDAKKKKGYFTEKKCVVAKTLRCYYRDMCVERGTKCGEFQTTDHVCQKWVLKKKEVSRAKCTKYQPAKFDADCPKIQIQKLECIQWGTETEVFWLKECESYGSVTWCKKRKHFCAKYEKIKRCHTVDHRPHLYGPKKCTKKNYFLKYKLVGQNVKRFCEYRHPNQAVKPDDVRQVMCNLFPDPHMVTFKQRAMEFQYAGDYQMYKSQTGLFNVHIRQVRWNGWGWTGMTAAAILVNGIEVVKVYAKNKVIDVNGDTSAITVGSPKNLKGGGVVKYNNPSQLEIQGLEGERCVINFMDSVWAGTDWMFGSVQVYTTASQSAQGVGACCESKDMAVPVGGLFSRRTHPTDTVDASKPLSFPNKEAEENARALCLADSQIKDKTQLKMCMFDLAQLQDPDQVSRLLKWHAKVRRDQQAQKDLDEAKIVKRKKK